MSNHTPELLAALENLLISATDQRNGYRDRDLHEPWAVTEARAKAAIVVAGGDLPDEESTNE